MWKQGLWENNSHCSELKCSNLSARHLVSSLQPLSAYMRIGQIYEQTKYTVQIAIVLVFNESSNTKIAVYTYLKLTFDGNYVGWA